MTDSAHMETKCLWNVSAIYARKATNHGPIWPS